MSRYIPEEIIRDIKARADIHDVISSYIPLKKYGNRWKALCPFHQEKTPSFTISPERQAFHCFGCGKGGNVFTFIMEKENVDFVNAAHILASRYGIIIPENSTKELTHEGREKLNQREQLYSLHKELALSYSKLLFSSKGTEGLTYLKQRGIPENIIKSFNLGFAPESWDFAINEAKHYGYSEDILVISGIAVDKQNSKRIYDRFRNRIMFPIWNEQGKIVAFSGRTIEENPMGGKYVNSPETPIFKKGNILYALPISRDGIRKHQFAILCEGQIDVIAMHRAEFNNTVAPQGTAFTNEQAKLLKRYTNKVYICFDGDTAGIKATFKTLEILLANNIEVKIIELTKGSDPDSIFRQEGKYGLAEFVTNAQDFLDFSIKKLSEKYNINSPFEKNQLLYELLAIISKIENSIVKMTYITLLAQYLRLPEKTVLKEFNKEKKQTYYQNIPVANEFESEKKSKVITKKINPAIASAEETLLELSIQNAEIPRRLEEELSIEMISDTPIGRALNLTISMTLNDERENIHSELSMLLNEFPDSDLSRVLSLPMKISNNYDFDKSVTECIQVIISVKLNKEINKLMADIKQTQDLNKKREITKKITNLRKEIIQQKPNS